MATDIAFALGVLSALGSRAPGKLRLFLTTLAIADDIGAIIVIAIFYSSGVAFEWLLVAALLLGILALMNRWGVDSAIPYAVFGILVWLCFLNSGVHATIAGVLVAMTIPTRSRMEPLEYCEFAREKLDEIEEQDEPGAHVLIDDAQQEVAFEIKRVSPHIASPLQRMEHALHPFTTFVVLPLFALANADIRIVGLDVDALDTATGGARHLLRPAHRQAAGYHRIHLAGGPLQAVRAAAGCDVEADHRRGDTRRHRVHDVAVHRHARVPGPRCS